MKTTIILGLFLSAVLFAGYSCSKSTEKTEKKEMINKSLSEINIYDINVKDIDGKDVSLSDYKGKVLLIVNVASQCGYTPQYEGLQKIYAKYKERGFEILAFPCNDFGGQEPGSNSEIKDFCSSKYSVTFTLFDKVKVLGNERSTLYAKLIQYEPTGDISWNFEKFLIDKNGYVKGRYKSKVKPDGEELTAAIDSELLK